MTEVMTSDDVATEDDVIDPMMTDSDVGAESSEASIEDDTSQYSLERPLETRTLLWYVAIWSLPFATSLFILGQYFFPSLGSCGAGSSCEKVRESVFGQVFGLPLATVGPFFYAIPLVSLYMIHVSRRAGNLKAEGFCWLFFMQFGLFALGFEAYLVYAQVLLEAYCVQCMILVIAVLGSVTVGLLIDVVNGDWGRLCLWPRPMIVIFAFILIHWVIHPTGSYDHRYSPVALKKMEMAKLRQETTTQLYKHPYEAEPYGMRKRSKLIVSSAEFDAILPELDNSKIDMLFGDDYLALKGGDVVPKDSEVILAHEQVETANLYPVQTYLSVKTEGDINAPIRMVLYADYGCHNCENFESREMPIIRKELIETGKLHLSYRYYDIKSYTYSDLAAKVSAAASFQGHDVWRAVHQRLFESRRKWSLDGSPSSYISDLVNLEQLSMVMGDYDQLDGLLKKEHSLGVAAGVNLVPSVSLSHALMKKPELFNGYTRASTVIEIVDELISELKESQDTKK